MLFGKKRQLVNEVFTPRRPDVNSETYIARPELEKELRRTLNGSMHTVLAGESGSGKSWLYKKVLADMDAYAAVANSANAVRFGSLTAEIAHVAGAEEPKRLVGMEETMDAEVNAAVAKSGLSSTRRYEYSDGDPLLRCFESIRKSAGKKAGILVIDNLETLFGTPKLMEELGAIITLLDDARYAEHAVKLLIVGVPSDVKEYFASTPNQTTVANRLAELSEVGALSTDQVNQLVERGFLELLKVEIDPPDLQAWQEHIYRVTLGMAQPVQEYCEQLGYVVEDADWRGSISQLTEADGQWLKLGLSQASVVVAGKMNSKETGIGRRNQVLYALGKVEQRSFHVSRIENIVREEFPESTEDVTLAIGQILSGLATGEGSILRRLAKGPHYEIRDARIGMALRVMLEKPTGEERVVRADG